MHRWALLTLAAFILTACSSNAITTTRPPTKSSASQAIAALDWLKAHQNTIQDLQNDLNAVTDAGNTGNTSDILAGCQKLGTDSAHALTLPPIPDPQIQADQGASLAHFQSASQVCVRGIQQGDLGLMEQYKSEVSAGIAEQTTLVNEILHQGGVK